MKVRLYCEGETEKGLKALLKPLFIRPKDSLELHSLRGNAHLLHNISRVTSNSIESKGAAAVFCLLDLHNIDRAFPEDLRCALGKRQWLKMTSDARVKWLRENVTLKLIEARHRKSFHLHVAVHEVEAWILADQECIKKRLPAAKIAQIAHPETIDDMKPPSKMLNKIFKQYHPKKFGYDKTMDGVLLLKNLDIEKVISKCGHFKEFWDDLRKTLKNR